MAELVREVMVDATPETIWPFLTEADKHVEWAGTEADISPTPGGIYRVLMGGGQHLDPETHRLRHGDRPPRSDAGPQRGRSEASDPWPAPAIAPGGVKGGRSPARSGAPAEPRSGP